ncbi:MAG: tetratricopeptide repeat protein [Clostridia bacterium]
MFKLNFEKTAIFVLILILLISTANISTQFFGLAFSNKKVNTVEPGNVVNLSFPVMLLRADELYKEGNYKEAQSEYLILTKLTTISKQQKATAYFKLGLCNYAMKLYDMACDSFKQSSNYNTEDAVAYNNAAVSAYLANNLSIAESYQKQAIAILPAVEFHYNLGRIYESGKKYEDAVKYYIVALKGEDNITRADSIDPVRVSLKVIKLFPEKEDRDKLSKELFIALKLNDAREVLIVNDSEMDIKSNFSVRLLNAEGVGKINCKYDRKEMDPYHLIDLISWVVKKDNKVVYTSSKDEFSMKVQEQDDYEVSLNIKYNGNKMKTTNKVITKWQIVDKLAQGRLLTYKSTGEVCKYYVYAAYEQVFEKDFRLSSKGYTDRFNVVWGKDNIETKIMEQDIIDAESSLYIKNTSKENAGIWADLTSLLDSKEFKGKTINIKFYARKITPNTKLNARLRVKEDRIYYTYESFNLDYRWKQYSMQLEVPENSTSLTISLGVKPDEEVKIDGFIINIVR